MTTDSEMMAMDYATARASEREAKRSASANPKSKIGNPKSSSMSKAQRDLYWSLWFKVCRVKNLDARDEDVRHNTVASILEWSGGQAKPFAEFAQPDFGVVKFAFTELAAGRELVPDQLKTVRDREHRKNLIYVITRLIGKYGQRPAMTLLRERFKILLIEELDAREIDGPMGLERIRETLTARTYGKRQAESGEREAENAPGGSRPPGAMPAMTENAPGGRVPPGVPPHTSKN